MTDQTDHADVQFQLNLSPGGSPAKGIDEKKKGRVPADDQPDNNAARLEELKAQLDKLRKQLEGRTDPTRPKPATPPTYSGKPDEDVTNWAATVRVMGKHCGWSDTELASTLATALRGRAMDWYATTHPNGTNDPDAIIKGLRKTFAPHGKEMQQLQQELGETASSFAIRVKNEGNRLEPVANDNQLLTCFRRGLRPALKDKVTDAQPDSFNEAVLAAEKFELALRQKAEDSAGGTTKTVAIVDQEANAIQALKDEIKNLSASMHDMQEITVAALQRRFEQPPAGGQNFARRGLSATCYNCGRRGHIARYCRAPRQRRDPRDDGASGQPGKAQGFSSQRE